jgi:hypothetical protein
MKGAGMAGKLKVALRSGGTIRPVGILVRSIDSEVVAKALGADKVVPSERVHGGPIGLHALRRELQARVRSTGGRPALDGATKIQKIPLKPEDWSRLEALAVHLSRQGVSATAGQVASVMVHRQLDFLGSVTTRARRVLRRRVRRRRASSSR